MSGEHAVRVEGRTVTTPRLRLRPWSVDDAEAALAVYGVDDVARWLSPAMDRVADVDAMRALIERWIAEDLELPQGRWAVELPETGELVGGVAVLPLPPEGEDLEVAWQLAPHAWGQGYAAEAGHAVAHHAFAVRGRGAVRGRPHPERPRRRHRAAGRHGVGRRDREVLRPRLQVYRLRKGELDVPTQLPPHALIRPSSRRRPCWPRCRR